MHVSKPLPVTMQTNLHIRKDVSSTMHDPSMSRLVVGALQYILVTCPELSYAVNKVCQFMHNPQEHHWKAVKRILRYLVVTRSHGLLIQHSSSTDVCVFSDVDRGSEIDDKK